MEPISSIRLSRATRLTDAEIKEQNRDFDSVDDEIVDDLNRQRRLDLIQHLLELEYLATEAHTIIAQDEDGDKVSDCEQLLELASERKISLGTYKREHHSIVIFTCVSHDKRARVEPESDKNDYSRLIYRNAFRHLTLTYLRVSSEL
jgi:hypothetical protein